MLFEYIDTYYYDSFFFCRAWNACANKMDLFIFLEIYANIYPVWFYVDLSAKHISGTFSKVTCSFMRLLWCILLHFFPFCLFGIISFSSAICSTAILIVWKILSEKKINDYERTYLLYYGSAPTFELTFGVDHQTGMIDSISNIRHSQLILSAK